MRCKTCEYYISRQLDNELSLKHSLRMQAHLDRCASCSELYQDYEALQAQLQQLPQPEFPPFLHHRILSALPRVTVRGERRKLGFSMAVAALSVILSLGAGTWVGFQGYSSSSTYLQSPVEESGSLLSFGENSIMVVSYDE